MASKKSNRVSAKVATNGRGAGGASVSKGGGRPSLADYMAIMRHMVSTGIKIGGPFPRPPLHLDELWASAIDKQIRALNQIRVRLAVSMAVAPRSRTAPKRATPTRKAKRPFKSKIKVGGPVPSGSSN
jgi:hypothetical protein